MAEFASVVDAVQCAVAVQKELQARNAELPDTQCMLFRIGINLGDVIEAGGAALRRWGQHRGPLEALAESGGICISGTAYDQVKNRLPLGYDFLGEQTVKHIADPVRISWVHMGARPMLPHGRRASEMNMNAIGVSAGSHCIQLPGETCHGLLDVPRVH